MMHGQTIRRGIAWLFVGNTSKQVLGFLFGIVLARLLAPHDFGTLLTIQVFTGMAGFVAGGGMGQALVRAKEASKADYDIVFTLQILIGSLIYAGFFVAAPWFARWYDNPIYTHLLRVSALTFIIRPLVNLPSNILYRNMRFKALTGVGFVSLLLSSGISIAMAYLGYGVWSLVLGGIVGSVLNAAMLIPLAKWTPGLSMEFGRGRDIARYGMLVSITDILLYLHRQVGIFILSRTLGPASVGLYNKGESLARMPHEFITGSVYQVLFRAMASEQDNLDKCRYLFFRSITLVATYATPFYVGLLWIAEPLVRGLYGANWVDAAAPLLILTLAWPFWLMNNLSGAVLAARNWLDREVSVQLSTLIVTALAVLAGLSLGIRGVAYAIVATSAYSALYMHWLAVKCLQAPWTGSLHALRPAMILNTLLALVLLALDHALPASIRSHDLAYVAIMATAGGSAYALAFLYMPLATLQAEQLRWKSKLRMTRSLA